MLKPIQSAEHVIAFSLQGKLSASDMKAYRTLLADPLKQRSKINIYVDLSDLTDINHNALLDGVEADLAWLKHLSQLNRCAFISDKEWPQTILSWAQHIFSTLEMKVFSTKQRHDALAWVAEMPQSVITRASAVRFLPTTQDNVLAFEIDGVISAEEMPYVLKTLEDCFARQDKVRLLNRVKNFAGFDPAILTQRGLISMKLSALEKVERYAIVGAPNWMNKIIDGVASAFPQMEMRTFLRDQEQDAWAWLEATPAETPAD